MRCTKIVNIYRNVVACSRPCLIALNNQRKTEIVLKFTQNWRIRQTHGPWKCKYTLGTIGAYQNWDSELHKLTWFVQLVFKQKCVCSRSSFKIMRWHVWLSSAYPMSGTQPQTVWNVPNSANDHESWTNRYRSSMWDFSQTFAHKNEIRSEIRCKRQETKSKETEAQLGIIHN